MNNIDNFINKFHSISKTDNITEVFTEGCCYWFAYIMKGRFPDAIIMYDPTMNHFAVEINGRLYDITGDVTDKYDMIMWDDYEEVDYLDYERVVRYCINLKD